MKQNEALALLLMGNNVFLTGQAGSGKTYILRKYVKFLKENKIGVAVTATTGIAATHLGGMTIHSWSGLGIKKEITEKDIIKLRATPHVRDRILLPKVLIIDEISMLHSYRLEAINRICKAVRGNSLPFGGLQVIVCGDFFQLPPIDDTDYPRSSFAYKAEAWEELGLKVCYLNEQHRQWDEDYLKVLNDIRTQEVDEATFEKLSARLNVPLDSHVTPTKLFSHNIDVDTINNMQLAKIQKAAVTYEMQVRGKERVVEALIKGCLAPQKLVLKEGALVMFVKNNPAKGYINGTLGTVTGFDKNNLPLVTTFSGHEVVALPASWLLEENEKTLAEISQIPLRLAWAITVHKSQGMTLDGAEVDLSKAFSYGMGYVALSRLKSLDGLKLLGINQMALQVDPQIAEIDLAFKLSSKSAAASLKMLSPEQIGMSQESFLLELISGQNSDKSQSSLKKILTKFFTV